MFRDKSVNNIAGGDLPSESPREKQGYLDLDAKSKFELIDLMERQNNLIAKREFISSLPDKGAKIVSFRDQLKKLISVKEVDEACDLSSGLILCDKQSVAEEIEWSGKYSDKQNQKETLANSVEDSDERDPLKILASQPGAGQYKKKLGPEKELIISNQPSCMRLLDTKANAFIENRCDKLEKPRGLQRELFQPHRSTISGLHSQRHLAKPHGAHWEVTAATPPKSVYGDTKLIGISESLALQNEQAKKFKNLQVEQARGKLKTHHGIEMGAELSNPELWTKYRQQRDTYNSSNSENEEEGHSECEEDEGPEKDGAVVYNIID